MATTHPMTTYVQPDVRAAAGVNDAFLLAGRILMALIFVSSGFHKFTDLTATAASIDSIIGWQTRLSALALALFTAIAAYFFHDFWHYPAGAAEHASNMTHFMKNITLVGGFLMLAGAGAGRYSIDGPCIRPEYLRR